MKFTRNLSLAAVLAFAGFAAIQPARAAQVNPTSYDMLNGETGAFTYWDDTYNGAGSTTTSLSPLTGGLGQLTDGITTSQNWFNDPAPYVGWNNIDPTIAFNFAGAVSVNSVTIHVDDSNGAGAVYLPGSVQISDGTNNYSFNITDTADASPKFFTFSGLNLNGPAISLTLNRRFGNGASWVFLDEVSFNSGLRAVPEPSQALVLGLGVFGLMGMAAVARKRRGASQAV